MKKAIIISSFAILFLGAAFAVNANTVAVNQPNIEVVEKDKDDKKAEAKSEKKSEDKKSKGDCEKTCSKKKSSCEK